jgi:hypothetical protein
MTIFEDKWKQEQADYIAEALQELLTNPDPKEAVEDALKALDYAFDSWMEYYEAEKGKWETLKMRFSSRL